jgi:hypothetical protein
MQYTYKDGSKLIEYYKVASGMTYYRVFRVTDSGLVFEFDGYSDAVTKSEVFNVAS